VDSVIQEIDRRSSNIFPNAFSLRDPAVLACINQECNLQVSTEKQRKFYFFGKISRKHENIKTNSRA
jgi:hypothetical protein